MSKEEYSLLPDEITLREIRYVIQEPGRKQQPFVIVTTMLDAKAQDRCLAPVLTGRCHLLGLLAKEI